ncbi:flavin reductase family protein [Desulforhabdus amnigena]|nr:flavin reductase family protein [Desulforhabdus amnigena]
MTPHKREFAFPGLVVFISTQDEQGVRNVAPYSNLMPILRPTDLVCVASWHKRDTLRNIRKTGEFVLNVPPVEMVKHVIPTAKHYPPETDEFVVAGLTPKASKTVKPPGIEGCLAWMECSLVRQHIEKEYVLIIGKVKRLEMQEDLLDAAGGFDPHKADPLMVLLNNSGMRFVTVKDTGYTEPYGAMFPDGKDRLAHLYK